jgi:crotonobetainyl-CoA:carnitine CoA-transferase CaiB-like acyl-CoA transferase
MAGPLAGVRVVEVATHVFVPISGGVLSEWGAEVIKVEHPVEGDPYRGLVTTGVHKLHNGVDPFFQSANRGKKSIGLDVKHPDGRALLSRFVASADVFVTNLRADARRRLKLEVDDIRADNPNVIYVRGTAFGVRGPDAPRGGYDSGSYWARTGMQQVLTPAGAEWPTSPRPAFGDVVGGLTIAGAISTALYKRATTGEPSVLDASLLASGLWQIQTDVVNAKLNDDTHFKPPGRYQARNPLMLPYRTADGRIVQLMMLSPDRNWRDLCRVLSQPEMADDPRFADHDARHDNAQACVEWLEGIFAERDLAEWRKILADFSGEWTAIQTPREVHDDPQVVANGFIGTYEANGVTFPIVPSPVQFDGEPWQPTRAPEHGEHTEEVLLDMGLSWDEIGALKESGAIL